MCVWPDPSDRPVTSTQIAYQAGAGGNIITLDSSQLLAVTPSVGSGPEVLPGN